MIYELRVYHAVAGQMPKLLARFKDKTIPIWETHGIRPIGFWTTLIGESNHELTYILQWDSLADREQKSRTIRSGIRRAMRASATARSSPRSPTRSSRPPHSRR